MGMEISKCFSYTYKLIPLESRFLLVHNLLILRPKNINIIKMKNTSQSGVEVLLSSDRIFMVDLLNSKTMKHLFL